MNRLTILALLPLAALLAFWGCDNDTSNEGTDPGSPPVGTDKTCLGCHQSEEMLKASLPDESGSLVAVPNKGDG